MKKEDLKVGMVIVRKGMNPLEVLAWGEFNVFYKNTVRGNEGVLPIDVLNLWQPKKESKKLYAYEYEVSSIGGKRGFFMIGFDTEIREPVVGRSRRPEYDIEIKE